MDNYVINEHHDPDKIVPCEPYELAITKKLGFHQTVRFAIDLLKEHRKVCLIGIGINTTKAANVAEELKAKFQVYQTNTIYFTESKDTWIPVSKDKGLENLEVIRHIPTINILLSKAKNEDSVSYKNEDRLHEEMIASLKREFKKTYINKSKK